MNMPKRHVSLHICYTSSFDAESHVLLIEHLPCVDCGALVLIRMPNIRTKDSIVILCDTCLAVRVAEVKAARQEGR
jgi:hypothetical protein